MFSFLNWSACNQQFAFNKALIRTHISLQHYSPSVDLIKSSAQHFSSWRRKTSAVVDFHLNYWWLAEQYVCSVILQKASQEFSLNWSCEKQLQLRVLLSDGGINNVSEAFLKSCQSKKNTEHLSGKTKSTGVSNILVSWYIWAALCNCDLCADSLFSDADTTTCFLIQVLVIPAWTTGHEGSINDIIFIISVTETSRFKKLPSTSPHDTGSLYSHLHSATLAPGYSSDLFM